MVEVVAVILAIFGFILLSSIIGLQLLIAARAAPPGRRGRAVLAKIGSMVLMVVMFIVVIAVIGLIRLAFRFVITGGSLN